MSSSMKCCVDRQATIAPGRCARASPRALSRCVLPRPLRPTSSSGLYFFPGCASTASTALIATWFDSPAANCAIGNAGEGAGGGPAPSRTRVAAATRRRPGAGWRGGRREAEHLLGGFGVDRRLVDRLIGNQPVQRAHQLAHVDEFGRRDGFQDTRLEGRPPLLRLAAQNRDPR